MTALAQEAVPRTPDRKGQAVGCGIAGPVYADDLAKRSRVSAARLALLDIADAQGDVDAFIGRYDERTRKVPKIAGEIVRRLLGAGRAEDAWTTLEAAQPKRDGRSGPDLEWEDARIKVLDALGRTEEAEAARWSCFERWLSAPHLRAYLKRLPDFEDLEAEERALGLVQSAKDVHPALLFLLAWPSLGQAAALVLRRAAELDGDHYEVLTPAAEALAGKHPLAATLALRAMIDFALIHSRSSRYGHAARHLTECASLASSVPDWGAVEPYEAYVARMRAAHERKSAFWTLVV
jgi:tetratricopeptide (TPR) repeat protein